MKRASTLFLRMIVVLVGIAVLAGLLREPQLEGRNANADQFTIYFRDPFLAYVYVGSVPFFFGLYQAFRLLGYLRRGEAFSPEASRALRRIKYCALATIAFILGAEGYIILGVSDDRAGAVMLGIVAIVLSLVITTAAAVLERVVQGGVELQAEHDLTV